MHCITFQRQTFGFDGGSGLLRKLTQNYHELALIYRNDFVYSVLVVDSQLCVQL